MNGDSRHNKWIQGLFLVLFQSLFFLSTWLVGFATEVSISTIWGVEKMELFITLNAEWYLKYLRGVACVWPHNSSEHKYFLNVPSCCVFVALQQIYQSWLDKSTPFYAVRWAATLLFTAVYMIRVYLLQVSFCFSIGHRWGFTEGGKGALFSFWWCRNTIVIWRLFIRSLWRDNAACYLQRNSREKALCLRKSSYANSFFHFAAKCSDDSSHRPSCSGHAETGNTSLQDPVSRWPPLPFRMVMFPIFGSCSHEATISLCKGSWSRAPH